MLLPTVFSVLCLSVLCKGTDETKTETVKSFHAENRLLGESVPSHPTIEQALKLAQELINEGFLDLDKVHSSNSAPNTDPMLLTMRDDPTDRFMQVGVEQTEGKGLHVDTHEDDSQIEDFIVFNTMDPLSNQVCSLHDNQCGITDNTTNSEDTRGTQRIVLDNVSRTNSIHKLLKSTWLVFTMKGRRAIAAVRALIENSLPLELTVTETCSARNTTVPQIVLTTYLVRGPHVVHLQSQRLGVSLRFESSFVSSDMDPRRIASSIDPGSDLSISATFTQTAAERLCPSNQLPRLCNQLLGANRVPSASPKVSKVATLVAVSEEQVRDNESSFVCPIYAGTSPDIPPSATRPRLIPRPKLSWSAIQSADLVFTVTGFFFFYLIFGCALFCSGHLYDSIKGEVNVTDEVISVRVRVAALSPVKNGHRPPLGLHREAVSSRHGLLVNAIQRSQHNRRVYTGQGRINSFTLTLLVVVCLLPYAAAQAETSKSQLSYSRFGGALILLAVTCMYAYRSDYWSQPARAHQQLYQQPPPPRYTSQPDLLHPREENEEFDHYYGQYYGDPNYNYETYLPRMTARQWQGRCRNINRALRRRGIDPKSISPSLKYYETDKILGHSYLPKYSTPRAANHPQEYDQDEMQLNVNHVPPRRQPYSRVLDPVQTPVADDADARAVDEYQRALSLLRQREAELEEAQRELQALREENQNYEDELETNDPPFKNLQKFGVPYAHENEGPTDQIYIYGIKYRRVYPGEVVKDERYITTVGGYTYIVVKKEQKKFDIENGFVDPDLVAEEDGSELKHGKREGEDTSSDPKRGTREGVPRVTPSKIVYHDGDQAEKPYTDYSRPPPPKSVYSKSPRIEEAANEQFVKFAHTVREDIDSLSDVEFASTLQSKIPMYYDETTKSGSTKRKKITAVLLLIPSDVSAEEEKNPKRVTQMHLQTSFTAAEYTSYRKSKQGLVEDFKWTPRNGFSPFFSRDIQPETQFVSEEMLINHPFFVELDAATEHSPERRDVRNCILRTKGLTSTDDPATKANLKQKAMRNVDNLDTRGGLDKKLWPLVQIGLMVHFLIATYMKAYRQFREGVPVKMTPKLALCQYIMSLVWNLIFQRPSLFKSNSPQIAAELRESFGLEISAVDTGGDRNSESFPFTDWVGKTEIRAEREERRLQESDEAAYYSDGEDASTRRRPRPRPPPFAVSAKSIHEEGITSSDNQRPASRPLTDEAAMQILDSMEVKGTPAESSPHYENATRGSECLTDLEAIERLRQFQKELDAEKARKQKEDEEHELDQVIAQEEEQARILAQRQEDVRALYAKHNLQVPQAFGQDLEENLYSEIIERDLAQCQENPPDDVSSTVSTLDDSEDVYLEPNAA